MREPLPVTKLTDHVVLVGCGRVGRFFMLNAGEKAAPLLIVEENTDIVDRLRQEGREVIVGNAVAKDVLEACNLTAARCLLVAVPNAFEGGQIIAQARVLRPSLPIVARAHSEEEVEYLRKHGATSVIMGEHEIARAMVGLVPQPA